MRQLEKQFNTRLFDRTHNRINLTEAGMGISILSRSTIIKELQLGTLTCVELDPTLERPFSFVHQKQKFRGRAIEELLDFTRSYCREQDA